MLCKHCSTWHGNKPFIRQHACALNDDQCHTYIVPHASARLILKPVSDLQIYHPHPASAADMTKFHAEDYIEFLQNVTPENKVC